MSTWDVSQLLKKGKLPAFYEIDISEDNKNFIFRIHRIALEFIKEKIPRSMLIGIISEKILDKNLPLFPDSFALPSDNGWGFDNAKFKRTKEEGDWITFNLYIGHISSGLQIRRIMATLQITLHALTIFDEVIDHNQKSQLVHNIDINSIGGHNECSVSLELSKQACSWLNSLVRPKVEELKETFAHIAMIEIEEVMYKVDAMFSKVYTPSYHRHEFTAHLNLPYSIHIYCPGDALWS